MAEEPCKRETAKKYKSRPAPPYKAEACANRIADGNDNNLYISVADARGVYKWRKIGDVGSSKTRKTKKAPAVYVTHDNGGKPFAVLDFGTSVDIYRQTYDNDAEMYVRGGKVYSSSYTKLWVGEDPLGITYDWDPSYMRGNSVLVQKGLNTYIFIGEMIYSFSLEAGDSVEKYVSPVGNNDVPYPYIIGKKNTYLLLDGGGDIGPKIIPNEALDLKIDAYAQFYGHPQAARGRELIDLPKRSPAVSSVARPLKRKMIERRIW